MFQNFLLKSKEEDSPLKAVDFGLSDFRKPGGADSACPQRSTAQHLVEETSSLEDLN